MHDQDELEEVEFEMETSGDAKKIILTLTSDRAMDHSDLILALEFYLSELVRADKQRNVPGTNTH
jgi:hypothetical protein